MEYQAPAIAERRSLKGGLNESRSWSKGISDSTIKHSVDYVAPAISGRKELGGELQRQYRSINDR